jgi:hypothetical protein
MKRAAHLVFLVLLVGCPSQSKPDRDTFISSIRNDLPAGWKCIVIKQDGKKGHPHGLEEPLMRIDLSSPGPSFQRTKGAGRELSPLIQLYLYDIADKSHVQEVIKKERLYSWDIPIYFGETEEYFIVTSPLYVNHGVFTEEAKQTIRPIWKVLRQHIGNKGDKTVEQLAQPDK